MGHKPRPCTSTRAGLGNGVTSEIVREALLTANATQKPANEAGFWFVARSAMAYLSDPAQQDIGGKKLNYSNS